MSKLYLKETALQLVANNKGILNVDDSDTELKRVFNGHSLDSSLDSLNNYRMMLLNTAGIEKYINGIVLHEDILAKKKALNVDT